MHKRGIAENLETYKGVQVRLKCAHYQDKRLFNAW